MTGQLPASFDTISGLEFIDLSGNQLEGTYPLDLVENNDTLTHFAIADNAFTGEFTVTPGSLPAIQHVDLSNNQFSETLPPALNLWSTIEYLDLSDNMF